MMTFDGVSTSNILRVTNVKRSILPSIENNLFEVDGRPGAMFVSKRHEVREIEVDVAIISDSSSNLHTAIRQIASIFDKDEPKPLKFDDQPSITYYAILDGSTELDEQLSYGFTTLKFICPDPYGYGATKTTNLVAGANAVTYNGTAKTYPVMTVTFASAQTFFEVSNGTRKVRIVGSLGAGQTLVINFKTGKVTINNVLNLQTITLDSDFFPLTSGVNNLTVSTGATVSMQYVEKFK